MKTSGCSAITPLAPYSGERGRGRGEFLWGSGPSPNPLPEYRGEGLRHPSIANAAERSLAQFGQLRQ